ncbi:MAG: MarC family protein, partial [Chlamydiota bacterium]
MRSISIAFSLFLILNSVGVVPMVMDLLKGYPLKKQRSMLAKDMGVALLLLLVFAFFGGKFFDWLHITDSNIRMAGGLILLLIAIKLIFPSIKKYDVECPSDEPF